MRRGAHKVYPKMGSYDVKRALASRTDFEDAYQASMHNEQNVQDECQAQLRTGPRRGPRATVTKKQSHTRGDGAGRA